MAKTKRTKQNKSPAKPYRNAKPYVANPGIRVSIAGHRTRGNDPKPIQSRGAKPIFIGRQYTGVARSKTYPYRSKKRGAPDAPAPVGLMARAAKAVKRVVVRDGGGLTAK